MGRRILDSVGCLFKKSLFSEFSHAPVSTGMQVAPMAFHPVSVLRRRCSCQAPDHRIHRSHLRRWSSVLITVPAASLRLIVQPERPALVLLLNLWPLMQTSGALRKSTPSTCRHRESHRCRSIHGRPASSGLFADLIGTWDEAAERVIAVCIGRDADY